MNKPSRRELLNNGQTVPSFGLGRSMLPLLSEKDCLIVRPLTEEPRIGDILNFKNNDGKCVIHRLVAVEGEHYIFRGDNNIACETVKREQIYGRVVEIIRLSKGGKTLAVDDWRLKLYSRFWMASWPLRRRAYQLRGVWFRMRSAAGRTWLGGKIKQHRRKAQ